MNIDINNLDAQQMDRMKHVVTSALHVKYSDVTFRNNKQSERLEFNCNITELHPKDIYIPYETIEDHSPVEIAKTILTKAWQFFKRNDEGVLENDLEFHAVQWRILRVVSRAYL